MSHHSPRPPEINVTPLIDVLLVLLIIFMVVSPSRPSELETKVPAKPRADAPRIPHADVLVLTLARDRSLTLNGTAVTADTLGETLAAVLADRADRAVIVRAPTALPYRDVVRVVDDAKGAGADPIGLQVDTLDS